MRSCIAGLIVLCSLSAGTAAKETVLDPHLHHLRAGAMREWSDFPEKAEGPSLSLTFRGTRNETAWTLRLRQQDVKQTWKLLLNGKEIDRLRTDENDTIIRVPIPPGVLIDGDNRLTIEQVGRVPDDIRVGDITLDDRPLTQVLNEATVDVTVLEAEEKRPVEVPCRITVIGSHGALATTGAKSGGSLAVRPGVIYSGDGKARLGLPAGDYVIHAGRGFAYGIASVRVSLKPGDHVRKTLTIRREVPTPGWVSCDTHVHTLTFSGHGDSTIDERMLTIAGEGIELPIATDHNCQVDYQAVAVRRGVRQYFTPVVGNEVTTNVGHFNVFPVPADGRVPDYKLKDWKGIFREIDRSGAKVVILNHPRDLHAGFRPFGPGRHLALTGEDLDGWELKANGVEVVNSGAQQTDVMLPVRDWFGLLNAGKFLTPIGSSDSHDVSRFIVGQGRTYIRCKDERPGEIDVGRAVTSLIEGHVSVSLGLLAEIAVGKYGPGDLAPAQGEVTVRVRVLGPGWTTADRVELYANGVKVREATIKDGGRAGVKWSGEWTLPRFRHDVHLVAVASGPGVRELYWPIAKPYQPASPIVVSRVLGMTGAVWLDSDGDGKRTCAREYARRLVGNAGPESVKAVQALADYDEAVAVHAAALLQARGVSLSEPAIRVAARKVGAHVERAFEAYIEAWRECQLARNPSR